ncbi:MAG TPA: acyl-CoA dehydratase activase, partial [Bacteroidota bacterium]|nr:acyl-CoA dehydratase activase [Bacteroidota bacterium]
MLTVGIDIGSTTAKMAVLNEQRDMVFSAYRRHNADIRQTLSTMLQEALAALGDAAMRVCITGSAGMGIAERCGIPFIQEAVSCASVVRHLYPDVQTLLDVGGEDTKLIFFDDHTRPDIRMNGSCAGGTGAFIDQMATLLDVDVAALDALAARHRHCYPIASRCGVFAKTDVQNLISRQIPKEDIAATIFQAVALQTKNTLARGRNREPKVILCGGPLTFFSSLRNAFADVFQIPYDEIVLPHGSHLLPAIGGALNRDGNALHLTIRDLLARTDAGCATGAVLRNTATPLFVDAAELEQWSSTKLCTSLGRVDIAGLQGQVCYLGIDSGSTTTKIVLIDSGGRIAFTYYANNKGEPITAVSSGLRELRRRAGEECGGILIAGGAVTGYGEDLIRAAFGLDEGIVETLAHYRAAREFNPDVTFILDIGGQDMKAIFIEDGQVRNVEINEACSSGCGSFLETFAHSLNLGVGEFAATACSAASPCDLGSRCTVFMNSRVKQSLREGTSVPDIAAGLAYSVIKNCIQKVLKIHDPKVLGDAIVVQGGTFRNPAVHRALEQIVGKRVLCPDIPELMGAYGAALTARDGHTSGRRESSPVPLSRLAVAPEYTTKSTCCRGCENNCTITTFGFSNGTRYFTGNKCEKVFSNRGSEYARGENLAGTYTDLLFERRLAPEGTPRLTIGVPRVLNMYENFPFWCTLFVESGIAVRLSPVSTNALCDTGSGTIMSDNICFPAKLVHGHIRSLMEPGVDRIFYPMVFHENAASADTEGSWNCPIVAAYPDVIRSAINPEKASGIPFDTPTISFRDSALLKKACFRYLGSLGVPAGMMRKAFQRAIEVQHSLKSALQQRAKAIIADSEDSGRPLVVLAARPYHLDPLINQKVPDILADLGANVLTVDALPDDDCSSAEGVHILPQWSYPNRLFRAARWVAAHPWADLVQLNSFGCGPDALTVDETKSLLLEHGRNHTLLRIDEVTSPGSLRLRIRSMIESVRRNAGPTRGETHRVSTRVFRREDRSRTILAPYFAPFYSSFIAAPFEAMGYAVEVLPPSDRESLEWGLRYTNNEICYPAILIIGDVIKALRSGRCDPDK